MLAEEMTVEAVEEKVVEAAEMTKAASTVESQDISPETADLEENQEADLTSKYSIWLKQL